MLILTRSYEPAFPADWEGLDLASAEECTPRWYGVSSGNGNDGVSHMYPDYYVRTCEPFALARAAAIAEWKPKFYRWAADSVDVDGEAEYVISATFYEGPNGETEFGAAELIVEVFPVDAVDAESGRRMAYDNLDEALSADVVALGRKE